MTVSNYCDYWLYQKTVSTEYVKIQGKILGDLQEQINTNWIPITDQHTYLECYKSTQIAQNTPQRLINKVLRLYLLNINKVIYTKEKNSAVQWPFENKYAELCLFYH